MTDNEIIKALKDTLHRIKGAEHLIVPKEGIKNLCNGLENALDLINRLQAKIERLKAYYKDEFERLTITYIQLLEKKTQEIKAEAYKEFADRLKKELSFGKYIQSDQIDNLLKEMVGENVG